MHHYQWNIGDYHVHTAHLEPLEDLAYRRLLDFYYLHEKPIPADVTQASKKIRMAEYAEAVRSVLNEFFIPSDDGWTHGRADETIDKFRMHQDEDHGHEGQRQTRLQRFRQKRSDMFQALQAVGITPPWNIKMPELRALFMDSVCKLESPETQRETHFETHRLPNGETALETASNVSETTDREPITNNQEPINKNNLTVVCAPHGEAPMADLLGIFPGLGGGNRLPNCPHAEILALWREELPDLPQHLASQWKGTRAAHLRARWRETAAEKGWTSEAEGLAYFRKFFRWLKGSPFLMGKVAGRNGRAFELELAWIVNPTNWAKTHEGKYHG